MPWATAVIRIRSNDRSSCTVLSMFTWGLTASSLWLGTESLHQRSLGRCEAAWMIERLTLRFPSPQGLLWRRVETHPHCGGSLLQSPEHTRAFSLQTIYSVHANA